MNNVNDAFSWLQSTGIVAFLIVVIPAVYKLAKPIMAKKIATEKNAHIKQALEIGSKLADAVVPEMAVMAGLSKTDRKKEAIRFVGTQLTAKGFDVDPSVVSSLVEQSYQAYKAAGGDNHEPKVTPAPTEVVEPTEGTDENV
ncbi:MULTISPECIES: hypothetical protein [unclassified Levilactobacillus]|uniref:hypothetical protein n=1 Tax=unclassified Levilactobacillus TaxID=2767918 RepID=UPI002FF3B6C8